MFIAGQRTWSRSAATFDAIDPATGEGFAKVALGDKSDVDAAVASPRAALEDGWAGLPPAPRVPTLKPVARLRPARGGGGAAPAEPRAERRPPHDRAAH